MYEAPGMHYHLVTEDIISSFDKHLLSIHSTSGPGLGAGDTGRTGLNKEDRRTMNYTKAQQEKLCG